MAAAKETIGDLRNNLMKLTREIKRMKLTINDINLKGLSLGCPSAFLPILHASLMLYSLPLANWLTRQGYELYAKSDLRFIEGLYKVLRDVFHYHPRLSKEQFLSVGFTEHKVTFTTQVLLLSQAKHQQLSSKEVGKTSKKRRSQGSSTHTECTDSSPVAVRADKTNNSHPPTNAFLSGTSYHNEKKESGVFKPPTIQRRYASSASPHPVEPSSDLELTPHPSPQGSPVSTTLSLQTRHEGNVNLSTPLNLAYSSANVSTPIQMTTSSLAPTHTQCSPLPGSSIGNSPTQSETETQVNHSMHEESQTGSEQVSALLNISSRIDGLVRMVETMSARVDLMETHLKMVESMQVQSSAAQSPARDQRLSSGCRDTSKRSESIDRDTHLHSTTPSTHLPGSCSHVPPSPHHATHLHTATPLSYHTTHSSHHTAHSSHHTAPSSHHTTHSSHHTTPSSHHTAPSSHHTTHSSHHTAHSSHLTSPTMTEVNPSSKFRHASTTHTPSNYTDLSESHQATPYSLSVHHPTPSTPEEVRRLIESLRSRAKKTRDFLQQANSSVCSHCRPPLD